MLQECEGHETFVEHIGYSALERARTEAPDVCILYICLPDMDGNVIARRLRSTAVMTQPILIAITGYSQDNDRKISFEVGFDHYLVKPVDLKNLVALLANLAKHQLSNGHPPPLPCPVSGFFPTVVPSSRATDAGLQPRHAWGTAGGPGSATANRRGRTRPGQATG